MKTGALQRDLLPARSSDVVTWGVVHKQMEVGLREANQAFSRIMKAVRRGEEVLVTERGKPLARIVPMRPLGAAEGMVQRLEASGFLRAATKPTRMRRGNSVTAALPNGSANDPS